MATKVYLVGFGPGDPELLTLKADRLLRNADVIFYDNLIDDSVLENYTAQKVYVGKRKGLHSKNQEEINQILFDATKSYDSIVRLKGGDPLIFGRVGEELQFLQSKGIEVEIVPGISSASAAAAACCMPLSQRRISRSIAYCTGHPARNITIPNAETLVFFMGATSFDIIIAKLIDAGWQASTPIAIVTNASLPTQSIVYTTIEQSTNQQITVASPSIIIVGKVAGKE